MQRRLAAAALLVLAVALLACGDDDSPAPVPAGEGQPRPFAMGPSALPAAPGGPAFPRAFAEAVSPAPPVFPVFEYEDMLGTLNPGEATLPAWSLVNRFEPKIDMLAVTSFPGFVYASANSLPPDYYEPLRGRS